MENEPESRTYLLDNETIADICSPVHGVREEAILQLPEALTRQELGDLAFQTNLAVGDGPTAIFTGPKLERDVLFYTGLVALIRKKDIVTAENAAKELRRKGIMGVVGYLMLSGRIRDTKRILATTAEGGE